MRIWEIITIVLTVFSAAFFAGSETAFVYTDENGASKFTLWWKKRMQKLLATTLIGTNTSIVLLSIVSSRVMYRYFGGQGIVISVIAVSVGSLIICEVVPKSLGLQYSTEFSNLSAPILWFISRLVAPFIWIIEKTAAPLSAFFGLYFPAQKGLTEDDILHFVSHEGTELELDKKKTLAQILQLENTPIYELMSPLAVLPRVPIDSNGKNAITLMDKKHRNIAIVIDEDDQELGFIERTEIFAGDDIAKLLHTKPVFLMTKSAGMIISSLSKSKETAALIVDEQGDIEGIITLRSLFAEITGVRVLADSKELGEELLVSGQISIRYLSQVLGVELPRSRHYHTLGGLLTEQCGRIPKNGEVIELSGFSFRIISANKMQIKEVAVNNT